MNLKYVIGARVAIEPRKLQSQIGDIHLGESAIQIRKRGVVIALGTDVTEANKVKVGDEVIYSKVAQEMFLDHNGQKVEIVDVRNIFAIIDSDEDGK